MKTIKTEIKWGVIFTLAALLWMVLEKSLGWHDEHIAKYPLYTNVFAVVAILIFVFALKEKRDKDLNGKMSWVKGFITGVIISLFVALLSPLAQYLTHNYISPEYFNNAIAHGISLGNNKVDMEAYFNFNNYVVMSVISALAMGILTSAIVAFFLKKK
ncbi:DUF4199 domain-containing protein [Flavobacterium sp. ASW18X]|uniref:DUF4199 domain-containing protein n=1 Tax=Flavobacterium sp. ASW18X TaxID=2572595 RepID=UPI0010ADE40C|nr:DUF4199 domain-containing protein [Flavobacterium sp. ASW18X]TKD65205.1 DUF4199 domain-containing protein [Flavobacterium sp. ASW18X]